MSPFIPVRPHSKEDTKKILIECTSLALKEVSTEEVNSLITEKDDILVIYELLLYDYVYLNHSINCEDFKAIVSKHGIVKDDPEVSTHFEHLANKLFELNSKFK